MKRVWLLPVLLLLILGSAILLRQPVLAPAGEKTADGKNILIGNQPFFVEVADNTSEREKGLSGRSNIDPRRGMLFVFDTAAKHCFWMKDTLVPLDMLWFNEDYKLVYIQQNVQPASYPDTFCPDQDARYVVELTDGSVKSADLKIGDTLTLR